MDSSSRDSFYVPLGDDRFSSTVHTTGPWDPRSQHGGPPSALLGRAVERCAPRDDVMLLGPVPVGELEVRARLTRPGRSVELVEAVMSAGGRDCARAQAWRVKRTQGAAIPSRHAAAPPRPDTAISGPPPGWVDGYLSAVEWRFARGGLGEGGPATAWTRLRHPLVPDEQPSPLQRVLAVADSGNGISAELDVSQWYFINPELTVHLHREAVGEWICLDAQTTVSEGGVGLATSVLSDADGPVAVGAQSLLVAHR
jgi:hypothetical protein